MLSAAMKRITRLIRSTTWATESRTARILIAETLGKAATVARCNETSSWSHPGGGDIRHRCALQRARLEDEIKVRRHVPPLHFPDAGDPARHLGALDVEFQIGRAH